MQRTKRNFKLTLLAFSGVVAMISLVSPITTMAATSPVLGAAASYSILAGSNVTNVGPTTVSGNLGISPGIGVFPHATGFPPGIVGPPGTIHDADIDAGNAQAASTAAFTTVDQGCDTTYAGTQDLTLVSPLVPGVYCADAFILTGNLNLTGSGVWIFKSASTLITSPGSSVTGGDPCNIWWRVASSATLDTTTSFKGNILALTAITVNNGASLNGRAFTQTAAVTLDTSTVSGPICAAPAGGGGSNRPATINVVKTVINDSGGTKTIADFPLFVNGSLVVSGVTNTITNVSSNPYVISETANAQYIGSFSGDCDRFGLMNVLPGDNKFCIVTNNDTGVAAVPVIPPLIDVVKVPNPLALPGGPGAVTYTYTLHNIGTAPVTDVTMVGDSCSPINLVSGDVNNDSILQVNETWIYRCSTTLAATHTNTVVATGWANGLSASDIASATVVVGAPIVPPLIHVTKLPNPLALSAGGGLVTYTEKITNPGTVALSNVTLGDDRCSPMAFVSGDTNGDLKLDPTETWTYTCSSNLLATTTNTAVATGTANGLTVRDFAIATVVVAAPAPVPSFPNAGLAPVNENQSWDSVVFGGLFVALFGSYFFLRNPNENL